MIMVGSLGAGAIMRKTGRYYWLEIVGACGTVPLKPLGNRDAADVVPRCRHHHLERHLHFLGLRHARMGALSDAYSLGELTFCLKSPRAGR